MKRGIISRLSNTLKIKYFANYVSNKSFTVLRREYNSRNKTKEIAFFSLYVILHIEETFVRINDGVR